MGPEGDADAQVQGHSLGAKVRGFQVFAGCGIVKMFVWYTGKAALAASSPGISGLRESASQLTSHPLEAPVKRRGNNPNLSHTHGVWVCVSFSPIVIAGARVV